MKWAGIILILLILILGAVFSVRILGSPEDNWICVDGSWIKHGNPASEMPITNCK